MHRAICLSAYLGALIWVACMPCALAHPVRDFYEPLGANEVFIQDEGELARRCVTSLEALVQTFNGEGTLLRAELYGLNGMERALLVFDDLSGIIVPRIGGLFCKFSGTVLDKDTTIKLFVEIRGAR